MNKFWSQIGPSYLTAEPADLWWKLAMGQLDDAVTRAMSEQPTPRLNVFDLRQIASRATSSLSS
jgi:hypothetical protein